MPRYFLLTATVVLAALLTFLGCESYWERRELEREKRDLQAERHQLRLELDRQTKGKKTFSDTEKAQLGPLWLKLRKVQLELDDVEERLLKL